MSDHIKIYFIVPMGEFFLGRSATAAAEQNIVLQQQ